MNGSRISGGIMQEHHRCWGACSWHTGITDCAHTTRVIPPHPLLARCITYELFASTALGHSSDVPTTPNPLAEAHGAVDMNVDSVNDRVQARCSISPLSDFVSALIGREVSVRTGRGSRCAITFRSARLLRCEHAMSSFF